MPGLWVQAQWVQIPALPLAGGMSLGKFLNLSFTFKMAIIIATVLEFCSENYGRSSTSAFSIFSVHLA